MNPKLIRFNHDKELFDELMKNENIQKLAKKRLDGAKKQAYRRDLLGKSLRITPKLAPKLYSFIEKAQSKMGLEDKKIEAYIYSDDDPNASCYFDGKQDIILTFSSGLLKSMSDSELQFVVGHEMGHACFEHYALPTNGILEESGIDASLALEIMSWSRAAELSADRAGLACSPEPMDAINSFLKLSCGVAAPIIEFDLEEYSQQMRDLGKLAKNLNDTSHCYSSHPFNPIRVMAVDSYAKSDQFASLKGIEKPDARPIADIDQEVVDALMFMRPPSDEIKKRLINTALYYGGVWVSYADGEYEDEERANLIEQMGEEHYKELHTQTKLHIDAEGHIDLDYIKKELAEALKPLLEASGSDRCTFLQRLVVVAQADGEVEKPEHEVLHEIAEMLKIEASFVQQILMFL